MSLGEPVLAAREFPSAMPEQHAEVGMAETIRLSSIENGGQSLGNCAESAGTPGGCETSIGPRFVTSVSACADAAGCGAAALP